MHSKFVMLLAALSFAALAGYAPTAAPPAAVAVGPSLQVPTEGFAAAEPITTPVTTVTGGVPSETVAAMAGVRQLNLPDATHAIVIARTNGLNLTAVELP